MSLKQVLKIRYWAACLAKDSRARRQGHMKDRVKGKLNSKQPQGSKRPWLGKRRSTGAGRSSWGGSDVLSPKYSGGKSSGGTAV